MQGIRDAELLGEFGSIWALEKKVDFPDLHMCILKCLEDKNVDNDSCLSFSFCVSEGRNEELFYKTR